MGKSKDARRLENNQAMAVGNSIRTSSRKLNLVAQSIRGLKVEKAVAELTFSKRRIAKSVLAVLKSAIANAENNQGLNKDDLFVAEAYANQAPSFKRVSFRGRGGVDTIIKRNCHITVVLDTVKK